MARKKLKDLPKSSNHTKTIGEDPLKKPLRGMPLSKSHSALACEYKDLGPYSADDVSAGSNREVCWLHDRCGKFIWVRGVFQHATASTSYVSAIDIFRLRRQLRAQAALKKRLLPSRIELIQKTHGWILDESGAVRMKNEPGAAILVEITRILTTLRVFKERSVNIEQALNARQQRS